MYKSTLGRARPAMSMRPKAGTNNSALSADLGPKTPINFKDEFVHSTAALAASHDETVSHILSRLDQLQARIQTQPESGGGAATPLSASSNNQPRAAGNAPRAHPSSSSSSSSEQSVHARLSSLESIHEDALHRLHSKLDQVEDRLMSNKETEGLMTQLAARLQQVEPRLQSHAALSDRITALESRAQLHSELHDRVKSLEAAVRPDPEQERILARINAKLDILEDQQQQHRARNARAPPPIAGDAHFDEFDRRPTAASSSSKLRPASHYESRDSRAATTTTGGRSSLDAEATSLHLDAEMERQDRIKYLQTRIEKLKELRSRYESAQDDDF